MRRPIGGGMGDVQNTGLVIMEEAKAFASFFFFSLSPRTSGKPIKNPCFWLMRCRRNRSPGSNANNTMMRQLYYNIRLYKQWLFTVYHRCHHGMFILS